MTHFTTEEWIDFARGLLGTDAKNLMLSHLEGGCPKCSKEAELWDRVSGAARRDQMSEPPQPVVRIAKAMIATHATAPSHAKSGLVVGRMLFDSLLAPLPAGIRSAAAAPRQVLFGAGNHRIDLRMEPQVDSEKVAIIGQVLDSANPDQVFAKVPISLYLGGKLIAASETNHLGEFQLECDLGGQLELRAKLPQNREISIALVEPAIPVSPIRPYLHDSRKESKKPRQVRKSTRRKA